jgi:hypothetical protein
MNHCLNLIIVFLVSVTSLASEGEFLSGEFDLVEIEFSSVSEVQRPIYCSPSQIAAGVLQQTRLFDLRGENRPGRQLKPSFQPLSGMASWFITHKSCPSLKPYYNGLGFSAIDKSTGQVTVYLAGFTKEKVDDELWNTFSGDKEIQALILLNPSFTILNFVEFSGLCKFQVESVPLGVIEFTKTSKDLICTLDNGIGFIKLRKR